MFLFYSDIYHVTKLVMQIKITWAVVSNMAGIKIHRGIFWKKKKKGCNLTAYRLLETANESDGGGKRQSKGRKNGWQMSYTVVTLISHGKTERERETDLD